MELTQEQRDAFYWGDLGDYVDLGDGHWYAFYTCDGACSGGPSQHHGIIQPHLRSDGTWCCGSAMFTGHGRVTWELHSLEPLDMSPSLLCSCGDHGFIRQGKWVRS
jgi:hypothetical protein